MSAGKKKSVPHWRRAADAIPFSAMFAKGGERNAQMERDRLRRDDPGSRLLVELERYLADPARAAAEDQQKLLTEAAKDFDAHRRGRPRPENAAKAHIRDKLAEHPEFAHTPTALRKFCDETVIGHLDKAAFGNTVAAILREPISHS